MRNEHQANRDARLRIVLGGEWTVGELTEFLRRLDEWYDFAHVLNRGLEIEKDAEPLRAWLQKSSVYSFPRLADLPEQRKKELDAFHAYFPSGSELRIGKLRIGSPGWADLLGIAKLVEAIGKGVRYLTTGGVRKDRQLNDIEVRERELTLVQRETKMMRDAGYPEESIKEVTDEYLRYYHRMKPFVDNGKVLDAVVVRVEPRALPAAGNGMEAKRRSGTRTKISGTRARKRRSRPR